LPNLGFFLNKITLSYTLRLLSAQTAAGAGATARPRFMDF
jgi:hypothetical protein